MADRTKQTDATHEFYSASGSRAPQPFGSGALLKDRYRIERELGRGGIGVVYLARDERLHSMPVVIKFLLDDSSQSAWLAKKFLQEAEALTRINHPGVVRVIDRDRAEDGKPFFVMEFINGKPLRSVMQAEGMDLEYVAALVRQIGPALNAAHREGVFHRDLKPENIMLETLSSGDEQIKLIDFGIAIVRDSQAGATTEAGLVAGSLNYIAPEQLMGEAIGPASDIYALAIIVYEMVTGRRPFNPDSPNTAVAVHQLMIMQQGEQVVPPKRLRPSLPESAQTIILNALACDASRRPQDARLFSDQLAGALADTTTPLEPTVVAATSEISERPSIAIQAPLPTMPHAARETRPAVAPPPVAGPQKKRLAVALILIALFALVIVGMLAGSKLWSKSGAPAATNPSPSPASADLPERVLNYAIIMQKDPRRYPGSKPFQLPGEVIFSPGDRVRLTFSSPQIGLLYVINESPALKGGSIAFNILFPSPTSNHGSAQLAAGQPMQIPERGDGFILDAEGGTEKLWLVWSAKAIDELEALKRWANPQDKGEIKDANQIAALREFLTSHATPAPEMQRDDEAKQTTLKARADTFVKLIKLEHH
ncbi:MAG: eukaryotic-like serine/threonine-protein kinase [Blastocatellia bacterium]